ncbi:VWA domain-containing protein [Streptomyces sp. SID13031]|uniref:vWA domain-containing protein n=1 Tax=Streptomyces sp. SID13031 TaxID=2706046 RepID=UPI0013CA930D|nr:VWA domain-containing protein [Streptomyces sp. SID13031]NEA32809.1 VWA domain-containing protein [Streptomyces sp. SID13031]
MAPETVLPFYVACDESLSMAEHEQAVAGIVASFAGSLRRAAGSGPARVRLGLIGFSDSAQVLRPLGPLGVFELPSAPRRGTSITSFRTAFKFLLDTIEADVGQLLAGAVAVRRPVVLFVSDGQPTDPATWPTAHAALTDPARPTHPHLLTVGVGDADAATLQRIATPSPPPACRTAGVIDAFTCSPRCSLLVRRPSSKQRSSSDPSGVQPSAQR